VLKTVYFVFVLFFRGRLKH